METSDRPRDPAAPSAGGPPAGAAPAVPSSEISLDEFKRVELRTAKVLAAEPVQGADKLLFGKTIVVVVNLKPAKLRGVLSEGMLLAASDESGQPFILTTEDPSVPAGWRVR